MTWWKSLKGNVRLNEPLKKHTSFKIGGPVKYFVEPKDTFDLQFLLKSVRGLRFKLLVIGAGSNILAVDKCINAVVVKLSSPYFKKITFKDNEINAGSGCLLSQIIKDSKNKGISGFEFFTGIPGTVGGALMMNAGAGGKNIGDLVEEVTVMDYNGKIKRLKRKVIKFAYRSSDLSKYIILSAVFRGSRKRKKDIEAVVRNNLIWRRDNQDLAFPSAGCVFKNPSQEISAGRLIDLCNLKGKTAGGACVSEKHANFIINKASAKAKDVLRLIKLIQGRVKNKFNIDLQPEVKIWH